MSTALALKYHARTNCGRDVIDFFASVAHSNDPDLKAYHRNRAIRTLQERGWGRPPRVVHPPCDGCDSHLMHDIDENLDQNDDHHVDDTGVRADPLAHDSNNTGNQPPAVADQVPATDNQPPTTGNQPLTTGNQTLTTGNQTPATGNQPPATPRQPTLGQVMAEQQANIESVYNPPEPVDIVQYRSAQALSCKVAARESELETSLHPLARYVRRITDDGQTLVDALADICDGSFSNSTETDREIAGRMILDRAVGTDRSAAIYRQIGLPSSVGLDSEDSEYPDPHLDASNPALGSVSDRLRDALLPILERAAEQGAWQPNVDLASDDEQANTHIPDYSMWQDIEYDPADIQRYVEELTPIIEAHRAARSERLEHVRLAQERRLAEESQADTSETGNPPTSSGSDSQPDRGPPPSRKEHESFFHPTAKYWVLQNCRHPDCRLHDEPIRYPEDSEPYYENPMHMGRFL